MMEMSEKAKLRDLIDKVQATNDKLVENGLKFAEANMVLIRTNEKLNNRLDRFIELLNLIHNDLAYLKKGE